MRTIEEIKADIERVKAKINDKATLLIPSERLFNATMDKYEREAEGFFNELRAALTADIPIDRLEEICNAEREGRCVVLPNIPKNKTLYWIWGDEIMPIRYKGVIGGTVTKDGIFHVTCQMVTKKDRSFPCIYRGKPRVNTYKAGDERYFYADDFGKTVFITHAEAEAKLGEGTP